MRRSDREVTGAIKIDEIINSCYCCRLGFVEDGVAYIVPLNFGFEIEDGKRVFYFHGALNGRKNDLMKQNPKVGFELDTKHRLIKDDLAENYTSKYQSVIGTGTIEIIENFEGKANGLAKIMKKYSGHGDWEIPEGEIKNTFIFKMVVDSLSCKENV
ncbi:MAG: pyridoxamine 5'-phosphate oxidase family protein [Clostridia bacterium]